LEKKINCNDLEILTNTMTRHLRWREDVVEQKYLGKTPVPVAIINPKPTSNRTYIKPSKEQKSPKTPPNDSPYQSPKKSPKRKDSETTILNAMVKERAVALYECNNCMLSMLDKLDEVEKNPEYSLKLRRQEAQTFTNDHTLDLTNQDSNIINYADFEAEEPEPKGKYANVPTVRDVRPYTEKYYPGTIFKNLKRKKRYPYTQGDCFYDTIEYIYKDRADAFHHLECKELLKEVLRQYKPDIYVRQNNGDTNLAPYNEDLAMGHRIYADEPIIFYMPIVLGTPLIIMNPDESEPATLIIEPDEIRYEHAVVIYKQGQHYYPGSIISMIDVGSALSLAQPCKPPIKMDLKGGATNDKGKQKKEMIEIPQNKEQVTKQILMNTCQNSKPDYHTLLEANDCTKKAICVNKDVYNKFNFHPFEMEKGETIKFAEKYKHLTTTLDHKEIVRQYPCDVHKSKPHLYSILPKPLHNTENWNTISYSECIANSLTTAKRALEQPPKWHPTLASDFTKFCDDIYLPKIYEAIDDFKYDTTKWFNTLSYTQQQEVKPILLEQQIIIDKPTISTNFMKDEKQTFGEKLRQVYGPAAVDKWILGPVINSLEGYLSQTLEGWGIGQTFEDKERWLNTCEEEGFTRQATMDISGLDKSHNEANRYPFVKIFEHLLNKNKIHHVDENIFRQTIMRKDYTQLYKTSIKGREEAELLCTISTRNKMPSGVAYTTMLNTIIMDALHQYASYISGVPIKSKSQGDDCCIAFRRGDEIPLTKAFAAIYSDQKNGDTPHGIGLTLKYFYIGNLEDATICSTEVFKCKTCGYKMIRDLQRYFKYVNYSRSALALSKVEKQQYCNDLAEADNKWAQGLPLFRAIIDKLTTEKIYIKPKKGKVKTTYPVTDEFSGWHGTRPEKKQCR